MGDLRVFGGYKRETVHRQGLNGSKIAITIEVATFHQQLLPQLLKVLDTKFLIADVLGGKYG